MNTKLVLWVLSLSTQCPKSPYQLSLYSNIWTGAFYENASQLIHELLIVRGHTAASENFRSSPVNYLYNFSLISHLFYSIEQIFVPVNTKDTHSDSSVHSTGFWIKGLSPSV